MSRVWIIRVFSWAMALTLAFSALAEPPEEVGPALDGEEIELIAAEDAVEEVEWELSPEDEVSELSPEDEVSELFPEDEVSELAAEDEVSGLSVAGFSEAMYAAELPVSGELVELWLGEGERYAFAATALLGAGVRGYRSSDPGIVSVDEATGELRAMGVGVASIGVATEDGGELIYTVGVRSAPTSLSFPSEFLRLGVGERRSFPAALPEGTASGEIRYASSMPETVAVDASGVLTGLAKGSAWITATALNGAEARCRVEVLKAPRRVKLSAGRLTMTVGESRQLKARTDADSEGGLTWISSDETVAAVDDSGKVTARKAGTATVRAVAFNGRRAACRITVRQAEPAPLEPEEEPEEHADGVTVDRMIANLRADTSLQLGGKKEAIIGVIRLLIDSGFEPAYAAGLGANMYSEGTYGLLESSRYISNYLKRPRYFAYLDGGEYYKKVDDEYVLTAVYLSPEEYETYEGEAEKRLRYGEENYYRERYSGKYVYNLDLNELDRFLRDLAEGGWEGKFGIGIVQWTGGRTLRLMEMYKKHADGVSITREQVVAAENEMVLEDLKGDYKKVYSAWKSENAGALDTPGAANAAGAILCLKYEIPASKETKAVTRGQRAEAIYRVMIGK